MESENRRQIPVKPISILLNPLGKAWIHVFFISAMSKIKVQRRLTSFSRKATKRNQFSTLYKKFKNNKEMEVVKRHDCLLSKENFRKYVFFFSV